MANVTKIVPVKASGFELDKRTYMPFKVVGKCPDCGKTGTKDLTDDYLSYPEVGVPYTLELCHDEETECSVEEWEVKVKVGFTLEVV